MKLESEIRVFHDLLTHFIFIKDFTVSQERISAMLSSGKTGEDDGDGDIGGWEFMTAALIQRNPNVVPLLEKKIECYDFRYLQSLKQIVFRLKKKKLLESYFWVCGLKIGVLRLEGMKIEECHFGHCALV